MKNSVVKVKVFRFCFCSKLSFSAFDDFFEFVAFARSGGDGVEKLLAVSGRVVAPTLEVAVLVNALHNLVVVFHYQIFGKVVPSLHHAAGIVDAFLV